MLYPGLSLYGCTTGPTPQEISVVLWANARGILDPQRKAMKVSVIIPTYNRAYILPDAIESVLQQTYTNFELIVVDDGSTDETGQVVKRFTDSRICCLQHGNNRGYSAALNTGLAAATGDLIAFIDSDDLWRQEKLQAQVVFLQDQPGIGGVFSDLEWVAQETQTTSMLMLSQYLLDFSELRRIKGRRCSRSARSISACSRKCR